MMKEVCARIVSQPLTQFARVPTGSLLSEVVEGLRLCPNHCAQLISEGSLTRVSLKQMD